MCTLWEGVGSKVVFIIIWAHLNLCTNNIVTISKSGYGYDTNFSAGNKLGNRMV